MQQQIVCIFKYGYVKAALTLENTFFQKSRKENEYVQKIGVTDLFFRKKEGLGKVMSKCKEAKKRKKPGMNDNEWKHKTIFRPKIGKGFIKTPPRFVAHKHGEEKNQTE